MPRKRNEPTEEQRQIAARVLQARHAANLTQRELAERVGVTGPTVQRWERGEIPVSAANLQKVG